MVKFDPEKLKQFKMEMESRPSDTEYHNPFGTAHVRVNAYHHKYNHGENPIKGK